MLFLIEYDRGRGEIVTFQSFGDLESEAAENSRLELELELTRQGLEREVVLLEAASEDALRLTHRRYFEDLSELVRAS
jgi:hypothetical protein